MVIPSLSSIVDNIKERTTNPFLGTFTVVWLAHNWKLVYSFFNFGKDWTLHSRLEYVDNYFLFNPFITNLLLVLLYTLTILIGTYLMLGLSRWLTEFYEKTVLTRILKATDEKSVVALEKHNAIREQLIAVRTAFDEEQQRRFDSQDKIFKLQKIIDDFENIKPVNQQEDDSFHNATNPNQSELKKEVVAEEKAYTSKVLSRMYHIGGITNSISDIQETKQRFHKYLRDNSVRQYSGGFGDDGKFSLQMLIDKTQDYVNLVGDIKNDRSLSLTTYTSLSA